MQERTEEELALLAGLLPNIALQLRANMTNLYTVMNTLITPEAREQDPMLDRRAAVFYQSYYRLYRLVNNLTEAGQLAELPQLVLLDDDVVGICRIACREAEYLFERKGVTLEFLPDRDSRIIAVNASALRCLLMNLLSNALKFTRSGGRVTVRVQGSATSVRLSVTDTGVGMSEKTLAHLFDGYLCCDQFDPIPHGLGLGLALCRGIAQGHGGMLVAESELGKGSTFTLSLPSKKCGRSLLRDIGIDYTGGFNRTLVELSDALDSEFFLQKNL